MIAFLLTIALAAPITLLPDATREYLTDDAGQFDVQEALHPDYITNENGYTYLCWWDESEAKYVGLKMNAISMRTFMQGEYQGQWDWDKMDAWTCAGECHPHYVQAIHGD